MVDLYYSLDEEDYCYGSLDEAVSAFADQHSIGLPQDYVVGDIIYIWEGTAKSFKLSDFWKLCLDEVSERAYDEVGDHINPWLLDLTPDHADELSTMMKMVMDIWADKYGRHPNFRLITKSKELKIKLEKNSEGYVIL